MKNIFIGILLALTLIALGWTGYEIWQVRKLTYATATYLFSETEIKGKDGKPLSRADLLDAILRDAIRKANTPEKK